MAAEPSNGTKSCRSSCRSGSSGASGHQPPSWRCAPPSRSPFWHRKCRLRRFEDERSPQGKEEEPPLTEGNPPIPAPIPRLDEPSGDGFGPQCVHVDSRDLDGGAASFATRVVLLAWDPSRYVLDPNETFLDRYLHASSTNEAGCGVGVFHGNVNLHHHDVPARSARHEFALGVVLLTHALYSLPGSLPVRSCNCSILSDETGLEVVGRFYNDGHHRHEQDARRAGPGDLQTFRAGTKYALRLHKASRRP